ncbi:hypothetical protein H2509_08535 [Stappia sp. F7233]|uniref:Uncharacterized protein n=1 Tax=Stappia albiluteola TaxID=2758565 RepID=A0A839ACF9_9HYPH|nr:hypothetical protein [Stappia albiluteola]MBA5777171.1 hypothetical protein [Stappia albiluteola]
MDTNLVKIRRTEVEREVERLKGLLAELTAELNELEITERTLERLSGVERRSSGEVDQSPPPPSKEINPKKSPTVRSMIKEALMDAHQRGLPGLPPKDIRAYIAKVYGRVLGQQINTTTSRMWRDIGELEKDEQAGLFRLPKKDRTGGDMFADTVTSPSTKNPKHDR